MTFYESIIEKTRKPPPGFDPGDIIPPPLKEGLWSVISLALDIAGECNLGCRYCAEAKTQPKRQPMDAETLETAWKFLFPGGIKRKGSSIRLGSGEPLLAFPLVKRIAELSAGKNGNESPPPVFLTTNGTLINDVVTEWLVTSGWNIKISLDGPEHIHDKWRVTRGGSSTYRQVARSVAALAKQIPGRLSVTAVLCRGTDPAEVFKTIEDLGVRRIELVPVAHTSKSVLPGSEEVELYRKFVTSYAGRLIKSKADDFVPGLIRFETCVLRAMGYNLERIPCGAGRSFVGVGPDGDLYPCFRFIGIEKYRIGHLSTGIDPGAAPAFRQGPGRSYETRQPCDQCWAAPLCGGPCFACAEMFGPGGGQPIIRHCAYTLANAAAAVFLVNHLREHNPQRLLSFLPGLEI